MDEGHCPGVPPPLPALLLLRLVGSASLLDPRLPLRRLRVWPLRFLRLSMPLLLPPPLLPCSCTAPPTPAALDSRSVSVTSDVVAGEAHVLLGTGSGQAACVWGRCVTEG